MEHDLWSSVPLDAPELLAAVGCSADGGRWVLSLVRRLKGTPDEVWSLLADPVRLTGWAPYRPAGIDLVGPDGLLTGLTKQVLETALEEELTEHLGYEPGDRQGTAGRPGTNERNGSRAKTVITEIGPVQIDVPRDRDGTSEPGIVRKRQRRLDGVDERSSPRWPTDNCCRPRPQFF